MTFQILQVPSKYSRYPPGTLQVPSRYPPGTLQVPSGYCAGYVYVQNISLIYSGCVFRRQVPKIKAAIRELAAKPGAAATGAAATQGMRDAEHIASKQARDPPSLRRRERVAERDHWMLAWP